MNWYGFIIACGIVICVIGAYFTAKRRGIEGDVVVDIIIFCLPLAILFARIYYVVFDIIDGGHWTFSKFIGFDDHGLQGLAIYGGLIGATIGAVLLTLWKNRKKNPVDKRISFIQILDLGFTFIILGQAIGRWGNFANAEAYGYRVDDPSQQWFPFAVFIESDGQWHYATFFYESMWNIIGFALLLFLFIGKHKSFDGFVFATYCIYYGIGRSWIEGLRSDALWLVPPVSHGVNGLPDVGGVRVSQLLSILLIIFGLAFIVQHIIRAKRAGKKVFIFVDQAKLCDEYFGYEKTKLAHPMPDIYGKKKKKTTADGDGIVVDSNGVAIREAVDGNGDANADGTAENAVAKNAKAKPPTGDTSDTNKSDIEEEYADEWDD